MAALHAKPITDREHRWRNATQTALLMGGIAAIVGCAGYLIAGLPGLALAAFVVAILPIVNPRIAPDVVMRMYRAQPISGHHDAQLTGVIESLSARAGLARPPRLFLIPSLTLNAFATGNPDNAAIALTEGLMRRLSIRELAAVLAHEISHIRHNDLRVMGLADVMGRFTQGLYYLGVALAAYNVLRLGAGAQPLPWLAVALFFLAPAILNLLQLGLSRTREYDADYHAALLTGDTEGLTSALRRVDGTTGRFYEDLMLPVPGRRVSQPSLLRTHPSTADRIARLTQIEGLLLPKAMELYETPRVSMVGHGPDELRARYRGWGLWY